MTRFSQTTPLFSASLQMSLFFPEQLTSSVASGFCVLSNCSLAILALVRSRACIRVLSEGMEGGELMEHGGEGENKRTHVQGIKKLEPKYVRGENRFFLSSTLFFNVQT